MNTSTAMEIAHNAARWVVEEGLEYGAAKRRALKVLGLPARTALPDNDVVDDAVREYLALYCADSQPQELQVLREVALQWMDRLEDFHPHLGGAVWSGTATRLSDIYLHLFCDDPKAAEIALINRGVTYEVQQAKGLRGEVIDALTLAQRMPEWGVVLGIHLLVQDRNAERGALRPDGRGRSLRGDARALRKRMEEQPL